MSNSNGSTTDEKEVITNQIHNPRKRLIDYFFDFFMLFLAVTLGFFVNSLNENLSDRQQEKQYMASLVTDLKIDTAEIQSIHSSISKQIAAIDSLMHILENKYQNNFINNFYYYSFKYLNSAVFHTCSDRTISQLKSAGGLRLIQKKGESDRIVRYYSSSDNVDYNTEYCLKEYNKLLDSEKEIFDFGVLRRHKIDSLRYLTDLKLLIDDPLRLNHFYNQILMYTSALINYNLLLTDLKKEAESLINFTCESYKFDNPQ
jgi:hypothetical protein